MAGSTTEKTIFTVSNKVGINVVASLYLKLPCEVVGGELNFIKKNFNF